MILQKKYFLGAALIVGILIAFLTVQYGLDSSFWLFPIFAVLTQFYHYKATGTFDFIFLIFLLSSMLSELLFLYDYENHINLTAFISVISSAAIVLLLRPVINFNFKRFSFYNITEIVIGFVGASYVVGFILLSVLPNLSDLTLFIPSFVAFVFSSVLCFAIPYFNRHTDNIFVFGVGFAYLLEMCAAFSFQFLLEKEIFLIIAIVMGVSYKILLAIYLSKMKFIINTSGTYF